MTQGTLTVLLGADSVDTRWYPIQATRAEIDREDLDGILRLLSDRSDVATNVNELEAEVEDLEEEVRKLRVNLYDVEATITKIRSLARDLRTEAPAIAQRIRQTLGDE